MKTLSVLICLLLFGTQSVAADNADQLSRRASRFFVPLSDSMPGAENDTAERVALGKKLFFDKRLSINDSQACASCHRLEPGFAGIDKLPTSPGAKGQQGSRNSPTVLNAGWQRTQFWDGRAKDLVEQAKGPILNPIEMGMPDEKSVEHKLSAIAEYPKLFAKAFPGQSQPLNYHNIAEAIAAFERTLITPGRFDDFLNGDSSALNETELRGLELFISHDCKSCHDGMLLGGESLEPLGKLNPYNNQSDKGLFALTGKKEDHMVFKTSSLRNVALTGPYFHDGQVGELSQAIRLMGRLQLNIELSNQEVSDLEAFLKTLTGKNAGK